MSSFHPEWSEHAGSETVRVKTLDQVMHEQEVDFIHYLKIDTEGHEMEVLRGAKRALSSRQIGIIQIEAGIDSDISTHSPFNEIRCNLAAYNYYPHGIIEQKTRPLVTPPSWPAARSASYSPSAIKYFDAVFVCASLDGIPTGT